MSILFNQCNPFYSATRAIQELLSMPQDTVRLHGMMISAWPLSTCDVSSVYLKRLALLNAPVQLNGIRTRPPSGFKFLPSFTPLLCHFWRFTLKALVTILRFNIQIHQLVCGLVYIYPLSPSLLSLSAGVRIISTFHITAARFFPAALYVLVISLVFVEYLLDMWIDKT